MSLDFLNWHRLNWHRLVWPFLFTVLALSLLVGVWPSESVPRNNEQRVQHLALQIRCPTCAGLSVGESNAPLAQSAREEIARRISAGETDAQIKSYFVSRYGDSALMSPPREGLMGVAWLLPALFGLIAVVGIAFAAHHWRVNSAVLASPSDEDRRLVDEALVKKADD